MERWSRRLPVVVAVAVLFFLAGVNAFAVAPTTLSATTLSLGTTSVGTTTLASSVNLTNNQATPLTINGISASGDFAVSGSTCPISPMTVAAGVTCNISVTFKPTVAGARNGTLTITEDAPDSPRTVALSGVGNGGPSAISPTSLAFGSTLVGATATAKYVTLMNNGPNPLSVSTISSSGDFAVSTGSSACVISASLAPTKTCRIYATFTPTATGARSGILAITDSADANPITVNLSGSGLAPTTIGPASLTFGTAVLNTTTAAKIVTVTNNSGSAITVSDVDLAGSDFAVSNNGCSTVNGGTNCQISVTFKPTVAGVRSGTLSITDSVDPNPVNISLSGSGIVATSISPGSLNFSSGVIGTTSVAKTVTLKNNNQTSVLQIASLALTTGSDYALDASTQCPNPGSLPAGASCTIALTFKPNASGTRSDTLTITHNAATSPQTVSLTGSGVAPVNISPTSISFSSTVLNTASAAKTVTVKNSQTAPLAISSVLFSGHFALDPSPNSATTCPIGSGTVDGNKSCVIALVYVPVAAGPETGQMTVIDNAATSPQTVPLSGLGGAATTVAPTSLNFGNVVQNTTSTPLAVTLKNNQAGKLNFAANTPFVVTGDYLLDATSGCPTMSSLASGASCNLNLTFAPKTLGTQSKTLTITHDAVTSPQKVTLSGTGVTPVSISPTALAFGTVVVKVPAVKSFWLTNNQTGPLTISSIAFTGGYALDQSSTCPSAANTLPAGAKCLVAVGITPNAGGSIAGTVKITHDASVTPLTVNITGTAVVPVVVSPTSLSFTSQMEGVSSAPKTVTVTNNQSVELTISGITAGNDFGVTTSCPTTPQTLAPGANCTVTVVFKPVGLGTRTGTLSIADDAPGGTQTVSLTGPGTAPVTLTPTSITTFSAPVGTTSAYKSVTIKNNQAQALTISSIEFDGDFIRTASTCPPSPASLAPGATCTVSLSLNPTIGGTRNGRMLVYDDAFASPQIVNLSGTGTSPLTISPASLIFSDQKIGTISTSKNIVLTNHETQADTFTMSTTGSFTATSNCSNGVIGANSACWISVNFVPTATGPATGTLTIAHSAAIGSPITAALSGNGTTSNPKPAILVVSPGAGTVGTAVDVTITGNGWTNFSPTSVVSFDKVNTTTPSGITVAVSNPGTTTANQIVAHLVIDANAVPGARNIRVVTGTETATLATAFVVSSLSNSHTITALSPNTGAQGQTLSVAITGVGTNFAQGVTYANFGDGIAINSLQIIDATDAIATIAISNTTNVGYRTVTLVTGGEFAASDPQGFLITRNNAALNTVTCSADPLAFANSCTPNPTSAPQGNNAQVVLTASGTHFLQDATQASFGSGINVGNIKVTSPTTAVADIAVSPGAQIGVHDVSVWTGGESATLQNAFTVIGATPFLSSVIPSSGQQGQTFDIEIFGTFTSFDANHILADFGGDITVNSYNVKSAGDVVINVSVAQEAVTGGRTARLTCGPEGGATIFSFGFTVTPSAARILSVVPGGVPQGGTAVLKVTGENTHWVDGTTKSDFDPYPVGSITVDKVAVTDATHATLNISISGNHPKGPHSFWMSTGGEVVRASVNVYAQTPTLSVSPANGQPGTTISVNFTGQFTHFSDKTLPVVGGQGVSLQNLNVTSPRKRHCQVGHRPNCRSQQ